MDVDVLLVLAAGVRHRGDVLAPTETYRTTAAGLADGCMTSLATRHGRGCVRDEKPAGPVAADDADARMARWRRRAEGP
ncbi:hypothetical protein HRW16_19630 [Streptomyces lunaelactis]|uniref:hypothetical protein n=1 Tax=Streptomyces lunaelactis TaxID=1535768 RepID=UPI0015847830|nr:hypothetical protein [Streptomyces lunaelactis]NUK94003.1 hypothetical protein [Streptomyces lunaelactis]